MKAAIVAALFYVEVLPLSCKTPQHVGENNVHRKVLVSSETYTNQNLLKLSEM
jgi:hypothetical protein